MQEGLKRFGFKQVTVVKEQQLPDPDFSTVTSPNPEEREAFKLAISYGEKINADILLATDPDADRLGVAVKNDIGSYTILTGNQIGALLIHYLIMRKRELGQLADNNIILKSIVTSEFGVSIAKLFGVNSLDTLTGFKYIAEKIEEFNHSSEYTFLIGYEESYGYLISDFVRDKDAIQAAVLMAEVTAYYKEQNMSLYDGLTQLYYQFGFYQESIQSITLKGKAGASLIEEIMLNYRSNAPLEVAGKKVLEIEDYLIGEKKNLLTGEISSITLPKSNVLKFLCEDDTWFCLRPSGTEPKIKMYFGVKGESLKHSSQLLKTIEQEVMKNINNFVAEKNVL